MSVLSDTQILAAMDAGQVVMWPERRSLVRGSSVDLALGRYFYRCRSHEVGMLNPFSRVSVERYFAGPYEIKPYASVARKIGLPTDVFFEGVPPDWPVLVLRPRERVLGHTHQFFGTHPPGTCEMRARSTWGRLGVAVCLCAGWGDPGYINRWTMEIHNTNDKHVIIPLGERICQMVVHECGESREHYGTETAYSSKYQQDERLVDVVARWEPSAMLPKAWKDERVVPDIVPEDEARTL